MCPRTERVRAGHANNVHLSIGAAVGNGARHVVAAALARFIILLFFLGSISYTVARIWDHARMGIVQRPHPRDRLSDVAVDQGSNDFASEVEPELVPLEPVAGVGGHRTRTSTVVGSYVLKDLLGAEPSQPVGSLRNAVTVSHTSIIKHIMLSSLE